MNQRNYQKELELILQQIAESADAQGSQTPALFLHSCCAPCSSYVLEYLRRYFRITVFYYNPNISYEEEYRRRAAEQRRLIRAYNAMLPESGASGEQAGRIEIVEGDYEPDCFYDAVKGLEQCPEGGERCFACYELRLRETAKRAAEGKFDYFATTLTISPQKNAAKLNEIGARLADEYGVKWLVSDFKKKGGYQRSIVLSGEYDLYRQNYCGCVFSKR